MAEVMMAEAEIQEAFKAGDDAEVLKVRHLSIAEYICYPCYLIVRIILVFPNYCRTFSMELRYFTASIQPVMQHGGLCLR